MAAFKTTEVDRPPVVEALPAGYDIMLAFIEPEPAEGPACGGLHCAVGDHGACALDRFRLVCIDRTCTPDVWDEAIAVGVGTLIDVSKRTTEETDDGEVFTGE